MIWAALLKGSGGGLDLDGEPLTCRYGHAYAYVNAHAHAHTCCAFNMRANICMGTCILGECGSLTKSFQVLS
eukprot:9093217-Pyramimonas_sp.AAC.1